MNKNEKAVSHSGLIVILALTVLAIVTRLYGLGQGPLTDDEIYTADFAAERISSSYNPAYYFLVLLSYKLLGISEFSARFPAMLLGIISVPVFFVTWRNVIGSSAALIGALLIVFSSWHLEYSQFSRFYSGIFLFGSLSYYFFYEAFRHDDMLRLAGGLLTALLGFLFHPTIIIIPAAASVYALLVYFHHGGDKFRPSRRVAKVYLIICSLAALVLGGLLLNIWLDRQSSGQSWGDGPIEIVFQVIRRAQLPIVVAAAFGILVTMRRDYWLGLYMLIGLVLPLGFVVVSAGFLNSRSVYLFFSLPLYIVSAAAVCEAIRRSLVEQYRLATYAFTALLFATLSPEFVSHYSAQRTLDVRDAVRYISAERRQEDIVLSFPAEFDYYARDLFQVVSIGNPNVEHSDWPARMNDAMEDSERAWVVVNTWRKPMARSLEGWLTSHGHLVWRRTARRIDYTVKGYEIFLVQRGAADATPRVGGIQDADSKD